MPTVTSVTFPVRNQASNSYSSAQWGLAWVGGEGEAAEGAIPDSCNYASTHDKGGLSNIPTIVYFRTAAA